MNFLRYLPLCCLLATAGCGYEDPRPDPTEHPDFVDTSDPSVVLGQQSKERNAGQKQESGEAK